MNRLEKNKESDFLFKKLGILVLSLLITLYPAAVLADDHSEKSDRDENVQEVTSSDDKESEDAESEDAEEEETEADEASTAEEKDEADDADDAEEADAEDTDEADESEESEESGESEESAKETESADETEETAAEEETDDSEVLADEEDEDSEPAIEGSINGEVLLYDREEKQYVLDVTVDATNNTEETLENIYAGLELPEGVLVLADVPSGVVVIEGEILLQLPELEPDETGEVSYQIPLLGQTDEVVAGSPINAYTVTGNTYNEAGQIDGNVNVDFTSMDEAWDFEVESQIVTDFPNLPENQFGLYFAFTTHNLTIDDVDKVEVEFDVPKHVTIHEPDSYNAGDIPDSLEDFLDGGEDIDGDLDIEWNGNTATINLDSVEGGQWNYGYFSAFGESQKSLQELEGMIVTVTLSQDGDEVKTIKTPFTLVDYEGEPVDPEDPEDPKDDGNTGEDGTDDESDDNGDGPDNDETNGDDSNVGGENGDSNNDGNEGNNDNGDEEDSSVIGVNENSNSGGSDDTLPVTATNMYSLLLYGSILLVVGGTMMFFTRKKLV